MHDSSDTFESIQKTFEIHKSTNDTNSNSWYLTYWFAIVSNLKIESIMTPSNTFPRRLPLIGPESSFVHEALQNGLPIGGTGNVTLFNEPRLPTGYPDLVAVFSKGEAVSFTPDRCRLSESHFKLLYHIHSVGQTSVDGIVKALQWRQGSLRACVHALEKAELIFFDGNSVYPRDLNQVFAVSEIIAIEAKLGNWKKVLSQAVGNTWFASESYILIPKGRANSRAAIAAENLGIGVLVFDGMRTHKLVNPVKFDIPASYGSWLINEWAIRIWLSGEQNDRHNSSRVRFSGGIRDTSDSHCKRTEIRLSC